MKKLLSVLSLVVALFAFPVLADLGIKAGSHLDADGGQSVLLFGSLEVMNQSLGWYVARTYEGSDPENILVGVDYGFKPFGGPVKLSIGPAYTQDPLRVTGQHMNFHLAAGVEVMRHFTVSIEHWSNCRRICQHNVDTTRNEPRNMLMAGVKF